MTRKIVNDILQILPQNIKLCFVFDIYHHSMKTLINCLHNGCMMLVLKTVWKGSGKGNKYSSSRVFEWKSVCMFYGWKSKEIQRKVYIDILLPLCLKVTKSLFLRSMLKISSQKPFSWKWFISVSDILRRESILNIIKFN